MSFIDVLDESLHNTLQVTRTWRREKEKARNIMVDTMSKQEKERGETTEGKRGISF